MTLLGLIHFAHPYWLLLIPAILITTLFIRIKSSPNEALSKIIDHNLIKHLEYKEANNNVNIWLGMLALCLCFIGISGISWSKSPAKMYESSAKTVLIVDQSLSMFATDIKPNRETQLKQTIRDILAQIKEGDLALVAFAGDAYTISPFSQDRETIIHFLLALDPMIMPLYGSNLTSGIKTALSLVDTTSTPAHFIVLTDSLDNKDQTTIPDLLKNTKVKLDLIAVGTEKAAPIQLPNGQQLTQYNKPVLPHTPVKALKSFTERLGGNFYRGRLTQPELMQIAAGSEPPSKARLADNVSINWIDQGHWFALPLLLWLAFQFRKGMFAILLLALLFSPDHNLQASPLDWFLTPDQKGQQAVDKGDWKTAHKTFQQPDWKAASSYALENYAEAAKTLEALPRNAVENYNLANALALSGATDKAIDAYKRALEQDPSLKEARENLNYLEQQKKHQNQPPSSKQKSNKPHQQQNKPSSSKQKQDNPSDAKKQDKKDQKEDKQNASEDNKPERDKTEQPSQSTLEKEKKQALDQWLRQIQDDPGSLLQRKLWYLHQERRHDNQDRQEDGLPPW